MNQKEMIVRTGGTGGEWVCGLSQRRGWVKGGVIVAIVYVHMLGETQSHDSSGRARNSPGFSSLFL